MRPEQIFKNITDAMRFGSTISNIIEVSNTSTIATDNIFSLENGMLVEIGNNVYQVSNITRTAVNEWTFDVEGINIIETSWKLALYYEYGRALEVGNTLEDKKNDPLNKNKRFPLIWLLTDIEKNYDTIEKADYQANIILGFIYISEENLKAEKRIDTYFEPILDPLVELFKNTIQNTKQRENFAWILGEPLKIRQTDKFKYGSINGNKHIFNNITDAIELTISLYFSRDRVNCSN